MQLDLIITQLRARCASFSNRVAGAAEFKPLPDASALTVPAAYVLPLDDDAGENKAKTGYRQDLTDGFAVVLVVDNTVDGRGQAAYASVHTLRAEVWKALLGWSPDEDVYDPIEYQGGNLLMMDRAFLYYQLEFSAMTAIDEADTWLAVRNEALPAIQRVDIKTDPIDPVDPNVELPEEGGPDGIVNFVTKIDLEQEP